MRRSVFDALVGATMIVLAHPVRYGCLSFREVPIFVEPDFLLLQAAMEAFDVAVAFRVRIRRSAMSDAQLRHRRNEAFRGELRSIVGGQGQARAAAALGKAVHHRRQNCRQCVHCPTAC